MIVMKQINKIVEEIDDVFCNKCEASCKGEMNYNGLIEVKICGGYDSTHLDDMEQHIFSLCEKCLRELIDTFKIPSRIDYDNTP